MEEDGKFNFNLKNDLKTDDNFELRSRIAIDRAPIASFRKLEIGYDISSIPSTFLNPPLSISPITRAMLSRIDSTVETEPLIVTDLARTGPDSDFTASITSISVLASALISENPISCPVYKVGNNIYFDEPIHTMYSPWSPLFSIKSLTVPLTYALDITSLAKIASHAIDTEKEEKWFGALKDGVEISERVNQRFYRETEKYLPELPEHFSRSFECSSNLYDIKLHVGTNSIICSVEDGPPCLLEYSEGDQNTPRSIQRINQWYIEAALSDCSKIIHASSEKGKITKFEEIDAPITLGIQGIFKFLDFMRQKLIDSKNNMFILHKNVGEKEIQILEITNDDLKQTNLNKYYVHRNAMLELFIGFRRSLSTSPVIVENSHILLTHASQVLDSLNSALCIERIADSIILPILLLDRYNSLISKPLKGNNEITIDSLKEAETLYQAALDKDQNNLRLKLSFLQKLATVKIHEAQFENNDDLAENAIQFANKIKEQEGIDEEEIKKANSFICQCYIWRGENQLELCDIDKAEQFANKGKEMIQTEFDKEQVSKLIGDYLSAKSQILLSQGKLDEASSLFQQAHENFIISKSEEDIGLSFANLAHIERQKAVQCTIQHKGLFSEDEEKHLNQAQQDYSEAIKHVSTKEHKQGMMLDQVSLYVSVLVRLTQAPPFDRLPQEKIYEIGDSTINASKSILSKLPENEQTQKQEAALNVWSARFKAFVQFPSVKSKEDAKRLYFSALNSLDRAKTFFIADVYPADFISIITTKAQLYLNAGDIQNAHSEILNSLKVFKPTTLSIAGTLSTRPQQVDTVKAVLPEFIEVTREVLKSVLKLLMEKKKSTDIAKEAYGMSLKATTDNIAETIQKAQSIKL